MQFLPSKSERYVRALRNYLQKQFFAGKTDLLKLKKIYLYSLCTTPEREKPTDIKNFFAGLFKAVNTELLNKKLKYINFTESTRSLKKHTACALICEIALESQNGGYIKAETDGDFLNIYFKGKRNGKITALIKALGGNFAETGGFCGINIYSPKTEMPPQKTYFEDYFQSRLSGVKIFLSK